MRAAAIPPILLAAAALAPGGCGTTSKKNLDKFKGAQHDVAQTVYDMRDAASRRDASKICDEFLSASLKGKLAQQARTDHRGTDCSDQLKDSLQDANSFDVTVESVTVDGSNATVRVKTNVSHGSDPTDTMQFVERAPAGGGSGGWRLNSPPTGAPPT
jgi:hypothetical protein